MGSFDDQIEKMRKAPLRRGGGNYLEGNGTYLVQVLSTLRKMGWNAPAYTVQDKELFICEFRERDVPRFQEPAHFIALIFGPEMRSTLEIVNAIGASRLFEVLIPREKGRAERPAGVPGGGLYPNIIEYPLTLDTPVGNAVQRNTARETQLPQAGFTTDMPRHAAHDLFRHDLDGTRHVHVAPGEA